MKTLVKISVFTWLLSATFLQAQNYRNAKAYVTDFGKNELFVKESLMEYSKSIIDFTPNSRVNSTLERIYLKLESLNENLLRNDIGIDGDTGLRDAFIQLNQKTVALLKNKSLKLNDYTFQSGLPYAEIFKNYAYKEQEIAHYYAQILSYEQSKKEFGLKYNITIRHYNKRNVFEYNAYQNLVFYKINILDDKLIQLLKNRNIEQVSECIHYMNTISQELKAKTIAYKNDYEDQSLIEANLEFLQFISKQNEIIFPLYQEYVAVYDTFQNTKKNFLEQNDNSNVEVYNAEVVRFNRIKNTFFDTLYDLQVKKSDLVNRWYVTNSLFLKNNIEFEDLYDKFTTTD